MSLPTLSCWVVSDGRRGIENQALGLAEAIARLRPLKIETRIIESTGAFAAAGPKMQFTMRNDPVRYGLSKPYPDLVIGCGRQAIAPLMALKKDAFDKIFTVYVQDPRIDPSHFDLVIAPEHDHLSGPNVESIIGSPNRISNTEIVAHVLSFADKLVDLHMPRVAMLIGGTSKTHKLSKDVHAVHIKAAKTALASGRSLLLTTSRRTPDWAVAEYRELASQENQMWFYEGGEPNPYFAFLGAAETILVTEDSTNMLTEACTAGKSVLTLPMDGTPGKFEKLYSSLRTRCNVMRFDDTFKTPDYPALSETNRAAQLVLDRLEKAGLATA